VNRHWFFFIPYTLEHFRGLINQRANFFSSFFEMWKDEWVISRVFQKNNTGGASTVSAAAATGSSKKTRMSTSNASSNMSLCPEPGSPSSIYLPPLLESSPYAASGSAAATFNDRENYSFESAAATAANQREHVSCFSTMSADAAAFNHLALPPEPPLDPFSRFHRNNIGVSAFPCLRSLHENLNLPFFFPPVVHGGSDVGNFTAVANLPAPEDPRVADGSSGMPVVPSELDCMWGYWLCFCVDHHECYFIRLWIFP